MNTSKIFCAALGFVLAGLTPAALAQRAGFLTVEITEVANVIARNLSVEVNQLPQTVQVPVVVAANVCGVAAVMWVQTSGSPCIATSTSTALDQVVQRQIKKS